MSAAAIPQSVPDRLALVLGGLRRLIALRAGQNHALGPMVVVLWNRLGRTLARIAAIAARHQAGTLRRPPKPRVDRAGSAATPVPRPPPRDQLPRQPGWLVRRIRETVSYGEYLRILLEDPQTRALIEAAPQLRRHFRPLWRMLRADPVPEILRTPSATPDPSRKTVRRTRKRRPAGRPPAPRSGAAPRIRPAAALGAKRILHTPNRG